MLATMQHCAGYSYNIPILGCFGEDNTQKSNHLVALHNHKVSGLPLELWALKV